MEQEFPMPVGEQQHNPAPQIEQTGLPFENGAFYHNKGTSSDENAPTHELYHVNQTVGEQCHGPVDVHSLNDPGMVAAGGVDTEESGIDGGEGNNTPENAVSHIQDGSGEKRDDVGKCGESDGGTGSVQGGEDEGCEKDGEHAGNDAVCDNNGGENGESDTTKNERAEESVQSELPGSESKVGDNVEENDGGGDDVEENDGGGDDVEENDGGGDKARDTEDVDSGVTTNDDNDKSGVFHAEEANCADAGGGGNEPSDVDVTVQSVEKESNDENGKGSGDDIADGVEADVHPSRMLAEPESVARVEDATNNSADDLVATGEDYTHSKQDSGDNPPSVVVLGTVQSTMVEDTTVEPESDDQEVATIKQENTHEIVTKWVVGENGELVRMPAEVSEEDPNSSMNGSAEAFNQVGEPWTQVSPSGQFASFPVSFTPETFPPQINPQGFLIQIEDLRLGDETHEDVSDFLHIPTEAVDLWRGTKKCPVVNCKGPALTLKHFFDWHWYVFHETLIKVYYCPVSGCQRARERWNTRRKRDLVAHLNQKHCVDKLPDAIETQIIKNPNYKPPKNFVIHPSAPVSAAKKQAARQAAKQAAKKKADLERTAKGMTKSGRVKKMPEELLSSYQRVQCEELNVAITPEVDVAWKERKQCPCEGCPKTKYFYMSEYRRHWVKFHVKYMPFYMCPDADCQMLLKGQQVQFRCRDLIAIMRHLTGGSHELTPEEARQVSAALIPTLVDNPIYIEPIIRPADIPKQPSSTPVVVKKKVLPENPVAVDGPRSMRHGYAQDSVDFVPKKRGRPLNLVRQHTASVADLKRRRALSVGKTAKAEGPTPAKKGKGTKAHQSDVDYFEKVKSDIVPREFLDWFTEENGCPSVACKSSVCVFKLADLIRHWKVRHVQRVPFYACPNGACGHVAKNKRALKIHIINKHHARPSTADQLILQKSAAWFDTNHEYEEPVAPVPNENKTSIKSETSKTRTKQSVKQMDEESLEECKVKETMWSEPEVLSNRSRSGKVTPLVMKSNKAAPATQTRRKPGPRSSKAVPENLVIPSLSMSVRQYGRATRRRGGDQMDGSLEQSAWQPEVSLVPLQLLNHSRQINVKGPAFKSMMKAYSISRDKSQIQPGGRKHLMTNVDKSPLKTPLVAYPDDQFESETLFEADDDDFSIDVPMPSMEDAGISIDVRRSPKSPGKAVANSARVGARTSGGGVSTAADVSDYNSAILALKQRQQELERRLENRRAQPIAESGMNKDVLLKITELQSQNEALRFQNEALRKQLMSGSMAEKWEAEKKQLEEQVSHKDVTITTLQDVIARLGMVSPTTSNNITNQMINLPGSRPSTRSSSGSGSVLGVNSPAHRLSITPHADSSRDGALQKCSVSLKSGASVNFEYDSFGDFMQKIGTLNDQYGLND